MFKVILAFLGLMILTSKAHAVTALVPVIAGFFGGGAIASLIVGLALSYIVGKVFAPEKEERETPADQGVKQRIPTDPRNKLPIVYGTKSVAGQITYASISGNNQKMAFIIALAEGPVTAINTVKWEDKTLSFSGDINTGLRSVSNSSPDAGGSDDFLNSGRFKVRVFPAGGRCSEMEGFDSDWNSNSDKRAMPNTAYAYCELTYDQEKRVTSLSNRLQFTITGRTVKPLTSTTTAASYESATEAQSNNPAEILVDYLTNTRYGAGVPLSAIDFPTFFSHSQFCDDSATYTKADEDGGGTATATRYTTNGSINTNQDVDQNVTDLTIGNSAMLTWNYGQFGIVSDTTKSSVFSFSEDNIFGKIQISKLGFDNKLNEITAKFDSLKSKEQEEQIIRSVPAINRNDNEPVLERTVTLPMTNNAIEARRVSAIYLNKSRQDLMINFTTSLEASGVESGDVISLTHETPGFTDKDFIVQSVEEKVVNNIIALEITAQEYSADAYNDTINDEDGAPNTRLPNPFASPVIENLVVTEDTTVPEPNLVLEWNDETDSPLVGQYEISYTPTVNTTEATTTTPNDTTLTVSSTAGFPDSGTVIIDGTESFDYTSKTGSVFTSTTDSIDAVHAVGTSVTLSTKNFRTVSGGTRYEISPLIAQVSYLTEVTPVSTLGNRGNTLTATGTTGVARVIGEAGAQGVDGLDGSFERAIYLNSNNTPPTPDAGNDFNIGDKEVIPPAGWENDPTESDTIQRWVSRATINTNDEALEESSIGFDTNATSGIRTLVQNGEKETGFFDVSGNPGTAVSSVFEESVITTSNVTGSTINNPAIAEVNEMSLAVSTTTGTTVGSQPAGQESADITITGTANATRPRSNADTTDRTVENASTSNLPGSFAHRYGQVYDNASLIYSGNVGGDAAIARSTDGGLSFTTVFTTSSCSRYLDVSSGTASGTHYFVACGRDGNIGYSTDNGASWTNVQVTSTSNDFLSIDFINGVFCICGQSSLLFTSTNPTTSGGWTSRGISGSPTTNLVRVKAGKNNSGTEIFVAVGTNGVIAADTATGTGSFSAPASGTSTDFIDVDYNEDDQQWAGAGGFGFGSSHVSFSTDGESGWSNVVAPVINFFGNTSAVACGNGTIVTSASPFFNNDISYSTDGGSSWTSIAVNIRATAMKFVGGFFLLSGTGGHGWFHDGADVSASRSLGSWDSSSTGLQNFTYIDDRIDNSDGSGGALVGSCWYLENAGGDFRYKVQTDAQCQANGNSFDHNFERCNRISATGTIFGVRESYFELDVDDTENGPNIFGGFLSRANSSEMATQMAARINKVVTEGTNTNLTATVAGSVVTIEQDNPGNTADITLVPVNDFSNETDPNSSYTGFPAVGNSDGSVVVTPGSAPVANRKTTYTITAPSGHSSTTESYEFSNSLTQAQALVELQGRFGTGNDFDNYTISGSSSPFTITSDTDGVETPNMTLTIDDEGTDSSNNPVTVTGSNAVTTEGADAFQTGGATTFSVSVNGSAEATDVSFTEGSDENSQAQQIVNAIGTIFQHTVSYTASTNVITITADTDGNKTDATISYTFVPDDGVSDFQPALSITDGVTGATPDGLTLDFKGTDSPASFSFAIPSNSDLDTVLSTILAADSSIDGVTLYDGNAIPTTTLNGVIEAGAELSSIEVVNTAGFPDTGTITLTGGDTFSYSSLTPGSDNFGSCTVGTHTDRTSCETEGVYTPHIRLNGNPSSPTIFTNGAADGATVTNNAVRFPGVATATARRVAWEYDDIRSNGEITTLTVTGTANADNNVTLTIDGTAVTAGVLIANTAVENAAAIRTAINTALVAANSNVTTVVGDVDNKIRLIGNQTAGDYTVSITETRGLTIGNNTDQEFENPTVGGDLVVDGGDAGGTLAISNFSIENEGADEVIIGALTNATVTINGVSYNIVYQGIEDDTGVFTPFEAADSQEIATQLSDFLNRQP